MNTVPRTPRAIFLFGMILGFTQWGCTRTVQLSDPDLKPFASMYAIDREQFGMTALPVTANVFIERHDAEDSKSRGYSVMLHIYGKAFHHVAFRFEKSRYEWVGEQEQCWGPRDYQTMDGRFKVVVQFELYQCPIQGKFDNQLFQQRTESGRWPSHIL